MISEILKSVGQRILNGQRILAVDIGGAGGLQPHWSRFLGNSNFYMFEPHEESFNELKKVYRDTPYHSDFSISRTGLSGTGGVRNLYKTNCPTGSSILEPNADSVEVQQNKDYYFPVTTVPIETKTLREGLDEFSLRYVDAMKLDIQGAELEVLKSLDRERLSQCLLIECEVGLGDLYKGSTNFGDLQNFLTSEGFQLFDIKCNRAPRNVIGESVTYNEKYFKCNWQSPTIASRLFELDTVYYRVPQTVLRGGSKEQLRRLIFCYCVYNFFCEALYVAEEGVRSNLLSMEEANDLAGNVAMWRQIISPEVESFDKMLQERDYRMWAQYAWWPYPSS